MAARAIPTIFIILFFVVLAVATPWGAPTTTPAPVTTTITVTAPPTTTTINSGNCNTGPIQCCNSVQAADSSGLIGLILGLLDVVLEDVTALVGLGCSPISVIGVGSGNACSATPVCCTNNNVGGLISIGCIVLIL